MWNKLIELIAALPTNAQLRIEVERLINRVGELEEERADLIGRCHNAESKLSSEAATKEQFVKHAGVLWERESSGVYARHPVCPTCRLPMSSEQRSVSFICSKCHFKTPFRPFDLDSVMEGLSKG